MPKTDQKTLTGIHNNAIQSIQNFFKEFETVFTVKLNLGRLEAILNSVEAKYRI